MSTSRSGGYSRPLSSSRPMPPVGNSATVSSVTRSIQSGSMNINSTNLRQRPNSGARQTDISNERETNSETTRSRLSTHHRSVSLNNLCVCVQDKEEDYLEYN